MQVTRLTATVLATVMLAAAATQPAAAVVPSASLGGATLTGTATTKGTPCPSDFFGTGSYTFTASGVAAGPYPGTFTEQGSFTVLFDNEELLTFSATFTITSPVGTIHGQKSMVLHSGDGSCDDPNKGVAVGEVEYTATLPDGSCDSGTSNVGINFISSAVQDFTETFISDGTGTCGAAGGKKECRHAEAIRHHDAVKAEAATHKQARQTENALHRMNMQAATTAAERKAEEQRHHAAVKAEDQRHHAAVADENQTHHENQKECKTAGK